MSETLLDKVMNYIASKYHAAREPGGVQEHINALSNMEFLELISDCLE